MTLTNYWWLLIWLFTGGAALTIFMPRQSETVMGKKEKRWSVPAAIILVLPYIIWAGFRPDTFGDTGTYRLNFFYAPDTIFQLSEYLTTVTKDKGFSILSVIIKSIIGNNDVLFFLIIATFQMICLALFYRKYSCNYWISIFLFIASTDYMSFMHNGMRQFLAVSILVLALPLFFEGKYVVVLLLILLASTMHGSAILMIPILFIVRGKAWNKRTVLAIIACLMALVFVDQFTTILDSLLSSTQYSNMVTDWVEWEDDGTNPFRVLVYSIPMLISIIGYKYIQYEDDPIIHTMVNFSIITCGLALISMVTSGVFMGRLIIYTSVYSSSVLLPWEIEHIFNKQSARLMNIVMIVCYCIFFYYQMHLTWHLI